MSDGAPNKWNVFAKRPADAATPRFRYASIDGALALAGAITLAALVFRGLYEYAGPITDENRLEFVKTALTMTGFVGVVLAAIYAYRKQRISEAESHRADFAAYNDRYEKAAAQLGSEKAAVRLAGVYAMTRLADEWESERQTCVNVLCAYMRMPAQGGKDEEEVRSTIISVILDRTTRPRESLSWSGLRFDLRRASIPEILLFVNQFDSILDFREATIDRFLANASAFHPYLWFQQATIRRLSLTRCEIGGLDFIGASVEHLALEGCVLSEDFSVSNWGAHPDANIQSLIIRDSTVEGDADFGCAKIGSLKFENVQFMQEVDCRMTQVDSVELENVAIHGEVLVSADDQDRVAGDEFSFADLVAPTN